MADLFAWAGMSSEITKDTKMVEVYAFAGKRGSGKSTATQVLIDRGYTEIKFADPLKNMMRALYRTCGVDDATIERKIEGDLKESPCEWLQGQTPRWAMVTLGTEWRELIDTRLWSEMFVKRVLSGDHGPKIVCSDYRFPGHEESALDALNAYTYRIDRPSLEDDDISKHASECAIDTLPVRAVIMNSGTVADLRDSVAAIVDSNNSNSSAVPDNDDLAVFEDSISYYCPKTGTRHELPSGYTDVF